MNPPPKNTSAQPALEASLPVQPLDVSTGIPVTRIIRSSRRFERRGSRGPRKHSELAPSALSSAPPAGPVFVPAARVQRTPEHTIPSVATPPPAEPLTASLLARRWLNAAN